MSHPPLPQRITCTSVHCDITALALYALWRARETHKIELANRILSCQLLQCCSGSETCLWRFCRLTFLLNYNFFSCQILDIRYLILVTKPLLYWVIAKHSKFLHRHTSRILFHVSLRAAKDLLVSEIHARKSTIYRPYIGDLHPVFFRWSERNSVLQPHNARWRTTGNAAQELEPVTNPHGFICLLRKCV